jgi:hypothetical protein
LITTIYVKINHPNVQVWFTSHVLHNFVTVWYMSNETCTGESLKKKNNLEDQGTGGRMGSKWNLGRLAGGVWSGFTWLRIGTIGQLS